MNTDSVTFEVKRIIHRSDAITAKQLKQTFGELLCGQNQQLQKCVSALK